MFAWILIAAAWIGAFLLILHDATKHDNDGSAILIAAKSFRALISRTGQKTRKPQNTASPGIPRTEATASPTSRSAAVAANASTLESTQRGKTGIAEPVAPAKKKSWRNGNRVSATIPELELAITVAVKHAAPECEAFVGVIVQKKIPKSRLDVNWQLRGARFGNADRKVAGEILAATIENMQREFYLVER
jgi:hypothetical protein